MKETGFCPPRTSDAGGKQKRLNALTQCRVISDGGEMNEALRNTEEAGAARGEKVWGLIDLVEFVMQAVWEQILQNWVGKGRGFERRRQAGWGVCYGCSVGTDVSSCQYIYISFIPSKSRTFYITAVFHCMSLLYWLLLLTIYIVSKLNCHEQRWIKHFWSWFFVHIIISLESVLTSGIVVQGYKHFKDFPTIVWPSEKQFQLTLH